MQIQDQTRDQVISILKDKRKPTVWVASVLSEIQSLDPDRIKIRDIESSLTPLAYRQALKHLRIPKSFYDALDPKVRTKVLAHQRGLFGTEPVKSRFSADHEECQSMVLPTFAEVPAEDLLAYLPDWPFVESSGDYNTPLIHFRAAFKDIEVDEKTHIGFDFMMSELGTCDLVINAILYVVVCTNGLIRTRSLGAYFSLPMTILEGAELQAVASVLSDRLLEDREIISARIETAKNEMVSLDDIVEFWLQSKNVPRIVPKKVLARAEVEQVGSNLSVYALSQLVSNVGRNLESYPTRLHFETVAGGLLHIPITTPAALPLP